jgi:hypothetical protein
MDPGGSPPMSLPPMTAARSLSGPAWGERPIDHMRWTPDPPAPPAPAPLPSPTPAPAPQPCPCAGSGQVSAPVEPTAAVEPAVTPALAAAPPRVRLPLRAQPPGAGRAVIVITHPRRHVRRRSSARG